MRGKKKKFNVVTKYNPTKLFTTESLEKLNADECRLLYGILAIVPGTPLLECSTIAMALTPKQAVDIVENTKADFVEVWIMRNGETIASEKWEPEFFAEQFEAITGRDGQEEEQKEGEEGEPGEGDGEDFVDELVSSHFSLPDKSALNRAIFSLIKCVDTATNIILSASFGLGHPILTDKYIGDLADVTANVTHALLFSKGGVIPKFKEHMGVNVPYWTKKQIASARIDPGDEEA